MKRNLNSLYNYITGEKPPQKYYSGSDYKNFYTPPLNSFNSHFANRDGHASGWGQGHGQSSPAISALALLGFLFFLNLIQNSLLLNRQLMTTQIVTTGNTSTGTGVSAGVATGVEAGVGTVVDSSGKARRRFMDTPWYPMLHKLKEFLFPSSKKRKNPGASSSVNKKNSINSSPRPRRTKNIKSSSNPATPVNKMTTIMTQNIQPSDQIENPLL